MSAAHLVHDSYPAFVGVLLPLLISKLSLSLAEAGLLASGIRWTMMLQPSLGFLADRRDTRYWVVVAPATTAIVVSLIGIAPSFSAVFVLLLIAGVSHSAFHPAAAAAATRASGDRWGRGTSYFMTGGELGRTLGPLFIAAIVTAFGLEWSWLALFPGLVFSFLLYRQVGRSPSIVFTHPPGSLRAAFGQDRRTVLLVASAVVLRSFANVGFLIFLPTLLVGEGAGLVYASLAIASYELGGTAGAFLGGTASDRLGRRLVMAASLAAGLPLLTAAFFIPAGPLQLAGFMLAGFAILSAMPVQLVAMHELFPDNRSTATGINYFMGTVGAVLASIVIGALADVIELRLALLTAFAVSALAIPTFFLWPRSLLSTVRARA